MHIYPVFTRQTQDNSFGETMGKRPPTAGNPDQKESPSCNGESLQQLHVFAPDTAIDALGNCTVREACVGP